MKKLLGEIKDPGERIILSIQNASRIVEMQNFYNTTLKLGNGKYIFNKGTKGQMSIGANGKPKYPTKITKTRLIMIIEGTNEITPSDIRAFVTFKSYSENLFKNVNCKLSIITFLILFSSDDNVLTFNSMFSEISLLSSLILFLIDKIINK